MERKLELKDLKIYTKPELKGEVCDRHFFSNI